MTRHVFIGIRAALTVLFLYFGLRKLAGAPADVAIYEAIGVGQWPRPITGSIEVVAGLALWAPGFEAWAGSVLTVTMITGFAALSIFTPMPFWHLLALAVASAAVAWRWRGQLGL